MGKRSDTFELALARRRNDEPAYRWLSAALRDGVLSGRLRPGMRLPATRELAEQYGLSRGTIVRAFEELKAEGYAEGSVGAGTFVSRVLPEELLHARQVRTTGSMPSEQRRYRLSGYGRRATLFGNYANRPSRAFRANLPAVDLFPVETWTQVAARRLRKISRSNLFFCDVMGYMPLRRTVADYLTSSRGVRCGPEQIAIVSGMQEALDLTARLLLDPGDRVCMEDPGYPGAAHAFQAVGARVAPIGVDQEGMRFDRRKLEGARLVYITPAHQFPLGITMSLARRLQLLEWAQRSAAILFEDDYDSEFRYSGHPIPALQGLDSAGVVLFAGSFSKVLFPSLRLGYVVVPLGLVERFSAALSITTRHAPLLDQAVLCDFIDQGHFGRHLRRMRTIYAERLATLLERARADLAGLLAISDVQAGLQTAGRLLGGIDAEVAARAAAKRGVDVTPVSHYSLGKSGREALQIGFAAFDANEIRRGTKELAIVLEGLQAPPYDR